MREYYHSVTLNKEKCKGCTNCIKGCPTEAIRVRDGKARIIDEGMTRNVWANTESNKAALMKWEKVLLARCLADRLVRLQNRGY